MYLKANQTKLRFNTPQGVLSTEDLFDLPLTSQKQGRANLDDIGRALVLKIREQGDVSLVDEAKGADPKTALALDIVKDVIAIKKADNTAKLMAEQNRARREQIKGILESKKNEALSQKSIEELEAELRGL